MSGSDGGGAKVSSGSPKNTIERHQLGVGK